MEEDAKEMIQVQMMMLRQVLIKYGVSMYLDKEKGQIGFFDTDTYLAEKRFDGITVDIKSLVK